MQCCERDEVCEYGQKGGGREREKEREREREREMI